MSQGLFCIAFVTANNDPVGWVRSPAFYQLKPVRLRPWNLSKTRKMQVVEVGFRARSDYKACTAWAVQTVFGYA